MTRQRMGQHFLHDPTWQQRIAAALPRGSRDVWVEIGAGHGEMTRLLAAPKRRVIAIEGDPVLAQRLKEEVRRHPLAWPGVEVVGEDVLRCAWDQLVAGRFGVYGNLPYYITSPILHRLFGCSDRIDSIHVVVQLEVAARITARPGSRDYGYLSVVSQFYTKPEIVLRIPPGAFRPPPKVHSALLQMTLPGERAGLPVRRGAEEKFFEFVQVCFRQKRKTLRNNLRTRKSDSQLERALAACGIWPNARGEQLTLPQFAELFAQLG